MKTLSTLLASLLLPYSALGHCEEKKSSISETPSDRVNYPSNFQVERGWDFFIFGEYLYWTANEDGLYFAQTGFQNATLPSPPDGGINFKGKLKKIEPDWNNGLRLGVGVNFPKEGYDIAAYWTWFKNNSHASASGALIPLWAEPDFIPFATATRARGTWDLAINVADVEWGRSSWFGGYLSVRPFFGFRGAWIDQALRLNYTYATVPFVSSHIHSNADFHGGGMRAGADVRFALPARFGIYGIASGSLLYGRLNGSLNVSENGMKIARTRDHFNKGISSMQLGLGLGWDTHFYRDRLHIEFHIGWESNAWFSINQMNHFVNQLSNGSYFKENGNLSTQGIVAGGRFDF